MSYELLRVNIFVSGSNLHGEFGYHGDTFDMNLSRQRAVFIKQTAEELGVKEEIIHRDLGRVWLKLEELRDRADQTGPAARRRSHRDDSGGKIGRA